jgi:hypothetical protein
MVPTSQDKQREKPAWTHEAQCDLVWSLKGSAAVQIDYVLAKLRYWAIEDQFEMKASLLWIDLTADSYQDEDDPAARERREYNKRVLAPSNQAYLAEVAAREALDAAEQALYQWGCKQARHPDYLSKQPELKAWLDGPSEQTFEQIAWWSPPDGLGV